jgi:hypothetical protein
VQTIIFLRIEVIQQLIFGSGLIGGRFVQADAIYDTAV